MGRDDQPKERQRRQLERKIGRRPGFDRLLIVSEGSRTEPGYFREIIADHRLPSAHVVVSPSLIGTDPRQVVDYAQELFLRGDPHRRLAPKVYDRCTRCSIATITEASMTRLRVHARSTAHLKMTYANGYGLRSPRPAHASSSGCCCTSRTYGTSCRATN